MVQARIRNPEVEPKTEEPGLKPGLIFVVFGLSRSQGVMRIPCWDFGPSNRSTDVMIGGDVYLLPGAFLSRKLYSGQLTVMRLTMGPVGWAWRASRFNKPKTSAHVALALIPRNTMYQSSVCFISSLYPGMGRLQHSEACVSCTTRAKGPFPLRR